MGMIVSTNDGVSFTNSCKFNGSSYGPQHGFVAVAFNDDDGIFLAFEGSNSSTRLWTSTDGINWTSITPTGPNYHARASTVAYGNGIFVTGYHVYNYYSKDNGYTWYQIPNYQYTYNNLDSSRYIDQISSFIGCTDGGGYEDVLRFYRFE